ncbi:Gfo/Idh/MocA family protein [Paenibacillus sp.]|uniref:Gfo/Idh/MocA family protein n=1 Tax=Paenibacillus sp. TaxID=58172 RepID=UPI002D3DEE13|nr:Gfo/Idh/MocA family oxidoreductase [Paenibacillus sp.]HZG87876.1 Gfo/Idh/MocA family oxidoreductase [Paenibacillus sp.]
MNLKLGMIGLDTSHSVAFAELLQDEAHPNHVPGGRVTVAYPGGSPDIELSRSRVAGFAEQLRDRFGADLVDSPAQVAEEADAIMIVALDGRSHLELFREVAPFGKPVFIDKPLAVSHREALAIRDLSERYGTPVMSSSSLRFSGAIAEALKESGGALGADCFGPMPLEPSQPGLFWYGIHTVEMLYAILGPGCAKVTASTNDDHELVVGEWADGRIGTVRGTRAGHSRFGAIIHGKDHSILADASGYTKPFYAELVERLVRFFQTGIPAVPLSETLELIRFIEAANESRGTGRSVRL